MVGYPIECAFRLYKDFPWASRYTNQFFPSMLPNSRSLKDASIGLFREQPSQERRFRGRNSQRLFLQWCHASSDVSLPPKDRPEFKSSTCLNCEKGSNYLPVAKSRTSACRFHCRSHIGLNSHSKSVQHLQQPK